MGTSPAIHPRYRHASLCTPRYSHKHVHMPPCHHVHLPCAAHATTSPSPCASITCRMLAHIPHATCMHNRTARLQLLSYRNCPSIRGCKIDIQGWLVKFQFYST